MSRAVTPNHGRGQGSWSRSSVPAALAAIPREHLTEEETAALDRIAGDWEAMNAGIDKLVLAIRAQDMAQADALMAGDEIYGPWGQMNDATRAVADSLTDRGNATDQELQVIPNLVLPLTFGVLLIVVLFSTVVAVLVARRSRWSSRLLGEALTELESGNLGHFDGATSKDEFGAMSTSLSTARASLRQAVETVKSTSCEVQNEATSLMSVVDQVQSTAQRAADDARSVTAAAEQISTSIQTVAAGAEQMGASIREISSTTSEATRISTEATAAAEQTNLIVGRLGQSSQEIGEVIRSITAIAEQTNLLPLNATIEAITSTISRINDFQTTIAAAVEEQTATTHEMSRSVSEAATGSSQIAEGISGVADGVDGAREAMVDVNQRIHGLGNQVEELQQELAGFRS